MFGFGNSKSSSSSQVNDNRIGASDGGIVATGNGTITTNDPAYNFKALDSVLAFAEKVTNRSYVTLDGARQAASQEAARAQAFAGDVLKETRPEQARAASQLMQSIVILGVVGAAAYFLRGAK